MTEPLLPSRPQVERLAITYRSQQRFKKLVTDWTAAQGAALRLAKNSDAPMWSQYERAVDQWEQAALEVLGIPE